MVVVFPHKLMSLCYLVHDLYWFDFFIGTIKDFVTIIDPIKNRLLLLTFELHLEI